MSGFGRMPEGSYEGVVTSGPFEVRAATLGDASAITGLIAIGHIASHGVSFDDGEIYEALVTDLCGDQGRKIIEEHLAKGQELPADLAADYVVIDGIGAVVGFASGRDRVVNGRSGRNLDYLFVHERVRRQGVGGLLMNAYSDWAGDGEQMLEVVETNSAARRMYERAGFVAAEGSVRDRTYVGRAFRFQQMIKVSMTAS